jgi:hypothetical protein
MTQLRDLQPPGRGGISNASHLLHTCFTPPSAKDNPAAPPNTLADHPIALPHHNLQPHHPRRNTIIQRIPAADQSNAVKL